MQKELRATVDATNNPKLTALFAHWSSIHSLRELAMINAVEAFANHTYFEKGVLLVGSAHRRSLFEKSQRPRNDGSNAVTWSIDVHFEVAALS
jgi:hypothetical protein